MKCWEGWDQGGFGKEKVRGEMGGRDGVDRCSEGGRCWEGRGGEATEMEILSRREVAR